jgi:phage terminase large subunit-like protein
LNKLGKQTPTQKISQGYKKSDFKKCVELYERSKRKTMEWQILLLKDILAINKDGLWTHTKCGYSLPRRNGKSEILVMRELYALLNGEVVNHTAHRTNTSHASWEKLCRVLDDANIEYESLRATGRERVEIPETGGRVEFRTRTSTGGLGEGFDLLIIDEAQEYTDDQESALKYTVTSSKNPQTIMCGTPPTPISSGMVFVNFRKQCLISKPDNAYWVEWSVPEMSDMHDSKLWYETNPSLGTIFTERSIEDEIGSDETDFNIQRLGLWISYNQKSAITEKEWEKLKLKSLPILTGDMHVGIKYGNDGTNVSLAVACKTLSNMVFVEAIDCQNVRNGDNWIIDFLVKAKPKSVVIDGASRQFILQDELKKAKIKNIILPTVKEIINANSLWEQGIFDKTIGHMDQPSLSQVVTNCEKRNIGSSGGFGYRSQFDDMDISLMDACLLAHWAVKEIKSTNKQKIIY